MSEPNPVSESVTPSPEGAFGTSFEEALTAAFGADKIEPSEPKPDVPDVIPDKPEKVEEPVAEDIIDDIVLPIDDEPEVVEKEEEPDTSGMTKAASTRFKELRAEMKDFKTKLNTEAQARAQAEARVKELEALSGQSEETTKRIAEYELELSVAKLEATAPYRAAVTTPLADIAETADGIATKYGIDANKLLDAIALPDQAAQDEAFDDLLSGVNERDKLKIYAAAEKLPTIIAERDRLHENRDSALAELDARKAADEQLRAAENAKARKAASDLVAARVVAKLPFLKGESFNVAAATEKVAAEDFDAADVTTKAYNALSGRLVPQMATYIASILKDLETTTDELAKFKKASPSPKGGGNAPQPVNDNASFVEGLERAFAGIGA